MYLRFRIGGHVAASSLLDNTEDTPDISFHGVRLAKHDSNPAVPSLLI